MVNGATINTLSGNLKLTGGLRYATGTLNKVGSGTLTIAGSQRYGAAGSAATVVLNASVGTTTFSTDAGAGSYAYHLRVNAYGTAAVNLGSTQHLAALNLNDSSCATVTSNGAITLMTTALSVAAGAKLDLTNNNLIVRYSGSNPYAQVAAWVRAGQGDSNPATQLPLWNGKGITSSAVAADAADLTLGVVDNGYAGPAGATRTAITTMEGIAVGANDILVRFTSQGDLDLNGSTNLADYTAFKTYYIMYSLGQLGASDIGWQTGDLNGDGKVNLADYTLFKTGYIYSSLNGSLDAGVAELPSLQALADAAAADGFDAGNPGAAPEPSTLILLGLGLAGRYLRRRRR
jgi:hypothetical protein